MQVNFISHVDAFEREKDRWWVRFATRVGSYWVRPQNDEFMPLLQSSLQTGQRLQIAYDETSREILDVLPV